MPQKNKQLNLKDRLSHLKINSAIKLLNPDGKKWLEAGGLYDIDIRQHVTLNNKKFELFLEDAHLSIQSDDKHTSSLGWQCSCGKNRCEHIGAALAFILEEKTALGLAKAPEDQDASTIPQTEEERRTQALAERQTRADTEKMRVKAYTPTQLWSDYLVTNSTSGKSYRVALRGKGAGDSFCSCPDFRKNTLGTCKHILHTLAKVKKRFTAADFRRPYLQQDIALHLQYGKTLELRFLIPQKLPKKVEKILNPLHEQALDDGQAILTLIQKIERLGESVLIYPDAEEYLERLLFRQRMQTMVKNIRSDVTNHPLRTQLLKVPLLPYQLEGIAFVLGAGRAILADEMGLGKTIQGIGVAELLAREAGIERVLVITPASVKTQWQHEIKKFCQRDSQIIIGGAQARAAQYESPHFFTLCNYEQVLRDSDIIQQQAWDLIILDEGQRIKNWEAKTSQTIKALRSRFALVLTGTPLENRLDDLYSIVEFIDDRRLGPDFDFYHHHRVLDEKGKVIGYRNLNTVKEKIKPLLLRRTRESVNLQLPPRSNKIIRVTPTQKQIDLHGHYKTVVSQIVNKRYLSEIDLLRLQKSLLMCRMVADCTSLVDKQHPGSSSKLKELRQLLLDIAQQDDRKIILFSEWTSMLDLIEPMLTKLGWDFVRLDGSVPQKKRQQLVHDFQNNDKCRLFMTTNAGATGLNLQAANTIINVDLPWNPALLEQRIARAHRMGQKQAIQVYILVTEDTLEESLLATLSAKHELALAALDPDTDINEVALSSGIDALKKRLEVLLGEKPDAAQDEAQQKREENEIKRQQQLASAGGQLLTAAFGFLDALLPTCETDPQTQQLGEQLAAQMKARAQQKDDGQLQLSISLPDENALAQFSLTMVKLLQAGQSTLQNETAEER